LLVQVNGIASTEGNVRVSLGSTEAQFTDKEPATLRLILPAQAGSMAFRFENLAFSPVYLIVYHDQNANQKLDFSVNRMPLESYGFSGTAGNNRSADFPKAVFKFASDGQIVQVNLNDPPKSDVPSNLPDTRKGVIIPYKQAHPALLVTKAALPQLVSGVRNYPLLESSFKALKASADAALLAPPNVPTPADAGGGATHEQHKLNYQIAVACAVVYQITKDERYARYLKTMLMEYASRLGSWGKHPKGHSSQPGRIFWQTLNDSVWVVYLIQAYDGIYDYLSSTDHSYLVNNLWDPLVYELAVVNYYQANRMHNHATWNNAAIGMVGYVCGRPDWVELALRGGQRDGSTGFLKQLDSLFSPDGYYEEGPYYQRYAIQPFVIFAHTIELYQPELKIMQYRNGLMAKAVSCTLQASYTNKVFFPVNDALKDKTWETEELVYAVDYAYADMGGDTGLLDIARRQGRVLVGDAGLKVAQAVAQAKQTPFGYSSQLMRDGKDGTQGGLAILRAGSNDDQGCVVLKAAMHGMDHGHFDQLNLLYYDHNVEVFSDYGAVRFLNIETKAKGGFAYNAENESWAKQTVSHNTMVVDRVTQFAANAVKAEATASKILLFATDERQAGVRLQVAMAQENNAYPGTSLIRTVVYFQPENAERPLLIDVFRASSSVPHRYELPFWYQGHVVDTGFDYAARADRLEPLGNDNGYQHVWLHASGKARGDSAHISILNNQRFYTTSFVADAATSILMVSSGANDPDFNLRHEKGFIISHEGSASHTFASITESHGENNPIAEYTRNPRSAVQDLQCRDLAEGATVQFRYGNLRYEMQLQFSGQASVSLQSFPVQ